MTGRSPAGTVATWGTPFSSVRVSRRNRVNNPYQPGSSDTIWKPGQQLRAPYTCTSSTSQSLRPQAVEDGSASITSQSAYDRQGSFPLIQEAVWGGAQVKYCLAMEA